MISVNRERPGLCHVGGEDVHARIPMLQRLSDAFEPIAVGSDGHARFDGTGIAFHQYPLHRGVSPLHDMRSTKALTNLFEELRPDIVHAFDTKPAIYAMTAASQAGISVRMRTITGMGYLFSEDTFKTRSLRPIWTRMQRRIAPLISWTVFQNNTDRDHFHSNGLVAPEQSSVIEGSGVDESSLRSAMVNESGLKHLRQALGIGGGPVVMMAARLVIQKGVREFIAAARSIEQTRPDVSFLLVGPADGEGREALPLAELANVPGNTVVTGRRSDMVPLLQLADVFVLPSYYREGVPRVLLEAAMVGTAIVTTDMPGCREAVGGGQFGLLVPPRDAAKLETAILQMLDLQTRDALTALAAEYVRTKFSLARVTEQYRSLYVHLLNEAGRCSTL